MKEEAETGGRDSFYWIRSACVFNIVTSSSWPTHCRTMPITLIPPSSPHSNLSLFLSQFIPLLLVPPIPSLPSCSACPLTPSALLSAPLSLSPSSTIPLSPLEKNKSFPLVFELQCHMQVSNFKKGRAEFINLFKDKLRATERVLKVSAHTLQHFLYNHHCCGFADLSVQDVLCDGPRVCVRPEGAHSFTEPGEVCEGCMYTHACEQQAWLSKVL